MVHSRNSPERLPLHLPERLGLIYWEKPFSHHFEYLRSIHNYNTEKGKYLVLSLLAPHVFTHDLKNN